ncbi:molybdopterin-binding protein [Clostridium sp. NSJ-49]|uniref:molybdopterin-binding protein n=1 Tax=unclassified Clostridium TaxID=2614128 RepID=UPI00164AFB12|nr:MULTISPECIES: molybdopterin-binding protein [unclassified Clostridium]MBC5624588.1 molybdopterin-binding protein [Clostridium sp. NSJ-49]MCD2500713.1 molybdopterin-binding protein [Clostridium sp. NSJ-145]MDU6341579.1 molybdopterin-binding protein [Clostridium sp.]
MKMIRVEDAIGCILSHDVTQIIPGEFKGRVFKKGHIIKEEDIQKFLEIGKEHIYVWEPKEGELHENDAAIRISNLVVGEGVAKSEEIKEGKVDFFADRDGVLRIDKEKLFTINSIGEIIVSTLHNNTPIKKGEKIGATRVIPLIIDEKPILKAEELVNDKVIWVDEIKPKRCLLITTGNEVYKGRIKDAFLPVIKAKLGYYGSEVVRQVILPDEKERIIEEIQKGLEEKVDMIICTGGMSVDPDDVTPTAIKESGGELVTYGSPVLPGAMFLLAYHNDTPILGVPSCAMYSKRTVLDLVLPRVLADERLSFEDIAHYGHGGLCLDCDVCTFPHCSFGK